MNYPAETADEDEDDGTIPVNVADLAEVVGGITLIDSWSSNSPTAFITFAWGQK